MRQTMATVFFRLVVVLGVSVNLLVVDDAWSTIANDETRLTIHVINEQGNATSARAWVEGAGKRYFQPALPKSVTVYAKDRSFSCDGFLR